MKVFLQKLNRDIIIYILEFIYKDKIEYKDKYFKSLLLYNSFIELYNKIPKLQIHNLNQYVDINYIQYKYIYRKDEDKNNKDNRVVCYYYYRIIKYKILYSINKLTNIINYTIKKNISMFDKNHRYAGKDMITYLEIYIKNENKYSCEKNNIFILDINKRIINRNFIERNYYS
jgi:hypothetical protein